MGHWHRIFCIAICLADYAPHFNTSGAAKKYATGTEKRYNSSNHFFPHYLSIIRPLHIISSHQSPFTL